MGPAPMGGRAACVPLDMDNEIIIARHDAARARGEGVGVHAGNIVRAENHVYGKALERAVRHYRFRATAMLCGGLEMPLMPLAPLALDEDEG